MARGSFEETRFDQPAFPQFLVAMPLIGAVVIVAVMFSVTGIPTPLRWGIAAMVAITDVGLSIYFYRLSKSPAHMIIRRDELVVKQALRSQEDIYPYGNMLYFECRLMSGSRSTYWQTTGIRRAPLNRVKLPLFGSNQATKRGGQASEDNRDIQAFRLVKQALEKWQREHDVAVEPRLADRERGVLT